MKILDAGAVMDKKVRIAVLVSGGGTNLQALIDAQSSGLLRSGVLALVVSNQPAAHALTRAATHHIPTAVVTKRDAGSQAAFEAAILALLAARRIDMVVLAGFMSILTKRFTDAYADKILNVHPSLIPQFCGAGFYGLRVHETVLRAGVQSTGATVHLVNEIPDGGEILLQKQVPVQPGDTPERLQRRVMEEAEWVILPRATEQIANKIMQEARSMNVYQASTIAERIRGNSYVGRGIVLGKSADGCKAVAAYFIMGRSENSRNRVFLAQEEAVTIAPFDASTAGDPSLIIYSPVRALGNHLIVTNGNQTDTICDFLAAGKTFEAALDTREFEPDSPNFTPRISGMATFQNGDFTYQLHILKSADAAGTACVRQNFSYPALAGIGHFIHTYLRDGNPIPSFQGEPERVVIPDDIDALTEALWDNLDSENKVSLYVRMTDLKTGKTETRLINKNK